MSASCLRADNWASPMVANGAEGAGFRRACVSSLAAMMALSEEDILGMLISAGKNETVSILRSPPVLEQYTV